MFGPGDVARVTGYSQRADVTPSRTCRGWWHMFEIMVERLEKRRVVFKPLGEREKQEASILPSPPSRPQTVFGNGI